MSRSERPVTVRTLHLDGPAGRLEGLLNEPAVEPVAAAVVCHPHPLYGGTMHSKVVYRVAKGALEADLAVLRFNFRGVGRSAGDHDQGRGEVDDVTAALDLLARDYPGKPLLAAGFSFGAAMAFRSGIAHRGVKALAGIGLSLLNMPVDFLLEDSRSILLLHGAKDEHAPVEKVRDLAEMVGKRARLEILEDTGHFFRGQLETVTRTIRSFCGEQFAGERQAQ